MQFRALTPIFSLFFFAATLTACGAKGQTVYTVLNSTTLTASTSLQTLANATLNHVRGLVDGLRITHSGGAQCPFTAWTANNQTSVPGIEGRGYETFNLGYPENWRSYGNGLDGLCSGGTITAAEAYFFYLELTFTVTATSRTVRVIAGNVAPYKAGDILVKDTDGVFKWIDTANGDALVSVTETRPTGAHQLNGLKTYTNVSSSEGTVVLKKIPLSLSTATLAKTLTASTAKVVFDFNFTNANIVVIDPTSLTTVGKTLSIPFLEDTSLTTPHTSVTVTITPLEARDRGSSFDPAPNVGNG